MSCKIFGMQDARVAKFQNVRRGGCTGHLLGEIKFFYVSPSGISLFISLGISSNRRCVR